MPMLTRFRSSSAPALPRPCLPGRRCNASAARHRAEEPMRLKKIGSSYRYETASGMPHASITVRLSRGELDRRTESAAAQTVDGGLAAVLRHEFLAVLVGNVGDDVERSDELLGAKAPAE